MLVNRAGMDVRQEFGANEVGEAPGSVTGRDFFQFAVFVLNLQPAAIFDLSHWQISTSNMWIG